MDVRFERRFQKDLKALQKDAALLQLVQQVIEAVKAAQTIQSLTQLSKLKGFTHFYRIRVGDYRLGLSVQGKDVIFVRCLHRREIYRYFP